MSKTNSQKRLNGTAEPRALSETVVEFPKETGGVPAPEWFEHDHSISEWERLIPLLQIAKILTPADLASLAHYCDIHGCIIDMRMRRIPVPMSMYTQLRGYQADFALNPKSRIAPGGGASKSNKFKGRGKKGT